jgi:hypothetical protein
MRGSTMNRKHVIGYAATAAIALAIGGVSATSSATAQAPTVRTVTVQAPAVTTTVNVPGPATNTTPPECITAIELSQKVFSAVADEHNAIADAAEKASGSGDVAVFLEDMTGAMKTVTGVVTDTAPGIKEAVAACRATVE